MIYRSIEIHNCREVIKNEQTGLFKMCRIPLSLNENITGDGFGNAGVELRLVPLDDEVSIVLKAPKGKVTRAIIYYGGIQSGWQNLYKAIYDTPTEIVIHKAKNSEYLKRITKENNLPYSPDVIRVILTNGNVEIGDIKGNCRPPREDELPKVKYLAYGSSITHGSLAVVQPNTYVARVAENFNAEAINLGFAGNAKLEAEMADYIANECEFDFATLEMGINILGIDVEDFRNRVKNFVSVIAKGHPDKKIFCIDIFFNGGDMHEKEGRHCPELFRNVVKEVLMDLNLPNTVYVNGLECLNTSLGLAQDEDHPNGRGHEMIAANLTKIIKSNS